MKRSIAILIALPLAGVVPAAQLEGWREDPTRLHVKHGRCLTPEAYRAALIATGMDEAIARNAERARRVRDGDEKLPASTAAWTLLGPKGAFSGDNGRVSNVQIYDNGVVQRIFVGACQGGLWEGDLATPGVWTSIGDTLDNPSVRGFAVHPTDPSTIFVGTGDVGRYVGAGMFKTTDGGASWSEVTTLPSTPYYFYRILYKATDPDVLLAATSHGIFRSTDGGDHWDVRLTAHVTDVIAHPTDASIYYAARSGAPYGLNGVWVSGNSGQNWTQQVDPDLPTDLSWDRASLAICRDDPDTMAVIVENADPDGDGPLKGNLLTGVYKTVDGGADWTSITGTLPSEGAFGGGQNFHAQAIAIQPDNPNKIYVAAVDLAVTTNGGTDWLVGEADHGIMVGHADMTQLYFSPVTGDNVLYICNDGGIYWHVLSAGITNNVIGGVDGLAISEIDFMDADRGMQVIGLQDNGTLRSLDSGATWSLIVAGDGADVEITDPEALDLWYTTGVFDAPVAWQVFKLPFGAGAVYMQNEPAYQTPIFHDAFTKRMYQTGNNLLYSQLASEPPGSWVVEATTGWTQDGPWSVRRIWGSRANGATLFANYWEGTEDNERDVTIFERTGSSLTAHHSEDVVPAGSSVLVIAPSTEWPGECWVGAEGPAVTPKLFHTTDFGATWEDLTNELASVGSVQTIANTPFDPLTLYVGTDVGMYRSLDGGQSWQPFQEGLPVVPCSQLHFVPDDAHSNTHKLVLATNGRAMWSRDVVAPPLYYVDKNAWTYPGTPDGTFEHPYTTIAAAVTAAPVGATIAIRTETYLEPATTTKNVRLVTWAGKSVVH